MRRRLLDLGSHPRLVGLGFVQHRLRKNLPLGMQLCAESFVLVNDGAERHRIDTFARLVLQLLSVDAVNNLSQLFPGVPHAV